MPKYLYVFRNSNTTASANLSDAEKQAIMTRWDKWFASMGNALIYGGDALLPTGRVMQGNSVTDGPYIEAKELVGGFTIVQTESYDAAVELAKTCPIMADGGIVEVREMAGYNDMDSPS